MPTRSNYHLRNSSITFECNTTYMDTERHMSATVLETVLVDQDSFETVNNGALIINQSKLIKSRILHLLHDMCCGKTVCDESLTKHACSVIEGGKLKVQRDCLTNSHFNVSVSQTQTRVSPTNSENLDLFNSLDHHDIFSTCMTSSQPVHFYLDLFNSLDHHDIFSTCTFFIFLILLYLLQPWLRKKLRYTFPSSGHLTSITYSFSLTCLD